VLYTEPGGRHLVAWASAWDSGEAANGFAEAWVKQRQLLHQAAIEHRDAGGVEWSQPDGRCGALFRRGTQVLMFETDQPAALAQAGAWKNAITFEAPPEDAARAAANRSWLRLNPLFAWQRDADYVVTRTGGGLLSRHDRNSVGSADQVLLGLVGDWHRTVSFHSWELGWSLLAKHQSDSRRGFTKTTLLPWGLLYGSSSAELPQDPTRRVSRGSVLWGLAGSRTRDRSGSVTFNLLPGGILFRGQTGPSLTSTHILGTGITRTRDGLVTRLRFLGIPIWTSHRATGG
jgi:hypothetical protein